MQLLIKNINTFNNNTINLFYNEIYYNKKNNIDKILNIKKKKQSIIGEFLLKKLLKKNYNINYKDLKFKINKYGKPFILDMNIYYNISHSHDYVITAISKNKIGIDIEKIRKTNIKNIYQFSTKNELDYILSSKKNIEKRLFKIYTLKESYFKMKGTNLNNIKNVEFTINKNEIICSDKNVKVKIINIINNYIIAICEEYKNED